MFVSKLKWILLSICLISCFGANATHIVGGELNYKYIGSGQYKIVLNLYKDCGTSIVPFDDPASIYVYGENNLVIDTLEAPLVSRDTLSAGFEDTCLIIPESICVDFAQYEIIANFPPTAFGYTLAYIRCCRNSTILNANGRSESGEILPPDLIGVTYSAKIPGTSIVNINTNPEFKEFPPIILCAGSEIDVDQSAFDVDGDQLVYKLCTPFVGGSLQRVFGDPSAETPPFELINWVDPYGLENVLGGDIPLKINASTGKLTGSAPNRIGQFVVGVCVEEYRNGVLLSTTKRDFQFNIAECLKIFDAFFEVEDEGYLEEEVIEIEDSTIEFLRICDDDLEVQFNSLANGSDSIYWHFGDGSPVDTSANPIHVFPDTGKYTVLLIAQPSNICADTFIQIIDLQYQEVKANFTFNEPQCYQPELGIQFFDTSTDSEPIDNWQWDLGNSTSSNQENPTAFYDADGTFEVSLMVQAQNGCRDTIDTIINVLALEGHFLEDTVAMCNKDSLLIDLEIEGNHDYSWSPPIFLSELTTQTPWTFTPVDLTYFVNIITVRPSGVTCQETDSIHVLVDYPVPVIQDLTEHIQCDSIIDLTVLEQTDQEVVWALDSEFSNVIGIGSEIEFEQLTEIDQYFIKESNRFCSSDTVIEVQQHAITLNGESIADCYGDSSMFVLEATSNLADLAFEWTIGSDNFITNEPQFTFYTEVSADVQVLAYNESGCDAAFDVTATIYDLPIVMIASTNESVINQDEIQLSTFESPNYQYSWLPLNLPSISNPNVLIDETTVFVVTVEDENGCVNRDTIEIVVTDIPCQEPDIFVPNAFSPNNDALNDVFRIKGMVIQQLELQIFDRWGNIVFQSNSLFDTWDGFESPTDVYGYQLSILCFGGETYQKQGSITLVR